MERSRSCEVLVLRGTETHWSKVDKDRMGVKPPRGSYSSIGIAYQIYYCLQIILQMSLGFVLHGKQCLSSCGRRALVLQVMSKCLGALGRDNGVIALV